MEFTIVKYFEEGLKPSIKAKIDQDAAQLVNYKELIVKMIRAKVKVGLQSSSYIYKTAQHDF